MPPPPCMPTTVLPWETSRSLLGSLTETITTKEPTLNTDHMSRLLKKMMFTAWLAKASALALPPPVCCSGPGAGVAVWLLAPSGLLSRGSCDRSADFGAAMRGTMAVVRCAWQ